MDQVKTKNDLIKQIHEKLPVYTRKTVADIVDGLFETVKAELVAGNAVRIQQFGAFSVSYHKERAAYDPAKKARVVRPARYVPKFRYSQGVSKDVGDALACPKKPKGSKASGK